MAAHVRDLGYLPVTREVAAACGFGSPNTAGRLLDDLEALGALRRDPRYHRLVTLSPDLVVEPIPEPEQLWWCECDIIEQQAGLAALHRGAGLAPGPDELDALKGEMDSRAVVLRALESTRFRLTEGGASLDTAAVDDLERHRRIADAGHALLVDWDSYRAVRLAWDMSAFDALGRVAPMQLGYLGSSLMAASRSLRRLMPVYQAAARDPAVRERLESDLGEVVASLLRDLRQGHARQCPSHPDRIEVDLDSLVRIAS